MNVNVGRTPCRLAGKAIDIPKLRGVGPLVRDVVDPERELPAVPEPVANIAVPLAIAGSANGAVRGQGIGAEIAVLQTTAPRAQILDVGGERSGRGRRVRQVLPDVSRTIVARRLESCMIRRIATVQLQPRRSLIGNIEFESAPPPGRPRGILAGIRIVSRLGLSVQAEQRHGDRQPSAHHLSYTDLLSVLARAERSARRAGNRRLIDAAQIVAMKTSSVAEIEFRRR